MRNRRALVLFAATGLGLAVGAWFVPDEGSPPSPGPDLSEPPAAVRGNRREGESAGLPDRSPPSRPDDPSTAAALLSGPPATPAAPCVVGRQILFEPAEPRRAGALGDVARALLRERRRDLGLESMRGELVLAREFTSLSAHHVRLRQVVDGVPVEGSEVSAHVALDGRPLLLHADVFPVGNVATTPSLAAAAAQAAAVEFVSPDAEDDDAAPADSPEDSDVAAVAVPRPPVLVILPEDGTFPANDGARLAWRVDVRTRSESSRIWVDAADVEDGAEVLRVRDLRVAADGRAEVFAPNPVFSTRDADLRDARDADRAVLTQARVPVTLRRLDGTGHLRGTWVDATPTRGAPWRIETLDWSDLTRSRDGFEAVNAYWHVDRAQDALQALGITNANASRQVVDAHGIDEDQSYYDVGEDRIVLGDGGVDDGEDGDIVVHEYGHAIQADQVDGFGSSDEGGAMGEGFSDYLAATLHATGDPEWDPLVGCWDATSYSRARIPFLRRVDKTKRYPRDFVGEEHRDGEIWSRLLWDLRTLLGPDEALRLVVESHTFLTASAHFVHGANAVLAANSSLRASADDEAIRVLLRDRGLPFSTPPVGSPPEEASEHNDSAATAATLTAGEHGEFLLADDDWFRVAVAPFRRLHVRASFDPVALDLGLEVRTAAGHLVVSSNGVSGIESVDAGAGLGGETYLVRVHRREGSVAVAGYSLSIAETELGAMTPGRTELRVVGARTRTAYAIDVPAEKAGSRLVVSSRRRGARGAVNDVRLVSPEGDVVADFGSGRRPDGAVVVVRGVAPGAWVVELAPRGGTGGRCSVRAAIR